MGQRLFSLWNAKYVEASTEKLNKDFKMAQWFRLLRLHSRANKFQWQGCLIRSEFQSFVNIINYPRDDAKVAINCFWDQSKCETINNSYIYTDYSV